ncbi:MAG: TraB/GumN family protein [Gammaproteobacteria bacterium]|nr:MAG: TraB/GumN family protein [Gammaproteobacteria bacterium]
MNIGTKFVFFLVLTLSAGYQPSAQDQRSVLSRPIEEIVVIGKRPGPPLWKVTNGDNVLWIFGVHHPLPKSLEWDSESVEWIISQSTEYLTGLSVRLVEKNPLKAYRIFRKMKKLRENPNGQTLQDVLPPETYARFLEIKALYAPDNEKILELRPMWAAEELFKEALDSLGLTSGGSISRSLNRIAKKKRIEITRVDASEPLDSKQWFDDLRSIPLETELACFEDFIGAINSDLQGAVERAIAWADGDADLLKELQYPDAGLNCLIFSGSAQASRLLKQARLLWITSAERGLRENDVTFASLSIRELIHDEGLLEELRKKGYAIRGQ